MKLHIELNTNEPLNDRDKAILESIIGKKTVANLNVELDAEKIVNDLEKEIEPPVGLDVSEEKKPVATATEADGATDVKDDGTQSPADAITEPVQNATEPVSVELDSNGLPWDGRINASTKTQNKDGTWKRRKGVDDDTYDRVVDELKQTMSAGKSEPEQPVAPAPAPPPPAPQAQQPVTKTPNFNDLLAKVTTLRSSGRMNETEYGVLYRSRDLPNFSAFQQRPDLIPEVMEELKRYD